MLSLLLLFGLAASHNPEDSVPDQNLGRRTSDPVSNFFSELGDLILDVDQTIAVQNQPKIEHEANVMSQLFRPQTDYFNRIQNNYQEMQKRLGRLIGNTIGFKNVYSDHELSTVSPPTESFVPTIGPDYNPFAVAAEARKEKLKQRISEGSFEPKTSVPQTIDASLKAFGKLSQAIIDDIGDLPIERKPSKSVGGKKSSPKRTGSFEFQEECGNEVLEDPDLQKRRQEKCSQISAEIRARENLRKLMEEPKRATEALFSKSTETFDRLTKDILARSGDAWIEKDSKMERGMSLQEECSNEILEDPDLSKRTQERFFQIAAEKRARESLRKMMKEPKRATELLHSKSPHTIEQLAKDILTRSGDAWMEEDSEDECSNNKVLEDPDLEELRQRRCSLKKSEKWFKEVLRKAKEESERATEGDFSESTDTFDKRTTGILGASGDAWIENDQSKIAYETESVQRDEASTDECSGDVLEDVSLENIRREKCARIAAEEKFLKDLSRLLKDPKKGSLKWIPVGSEAFADLSSFVKRSGDIEDESSGDDLSVDKQIRQLIKDHGSWILDYPLLKRWREREVSIEKDTSTEQSSEETGHTTAEDSSDIEVESTEFYLPVSEDYKMALPKSGDFVSVNPHESSYYRIVNQDGGIMEEEIDFVLHPESISNDIEAVEPKETVILAFTSDGVPLKLRVGPEIDNPIQYLHKVLQSAGVSLNIPVESYDDLEPVGKEVLKLGSGILTRAVLINASNSNELKSLLKALMVSKSSGKTSF